MRKRVRWKASEVDLAMTLARNFDRYLANREWCLNFQSDNEAIEWNDEITRTLLYLQALGLPDVVLQSLIGFNHSLEEFIKEKPKTAKSLPRILQNRTPLRLKQYKE